MARFQENHKARRKIEQKLKDNLDILGEILATQTRLNIAGQGVDPSLKAVDEGQHINSVFHERDKFSLIVGFDGSAAHSVFVELGTKKMPARPSLQKAIYGNEKLIRKVLSGK